MKINIEISPGELLDKISILEIKLEYIKDESKLLNIKYEFDLLAKSRDTAICFTPEILLLYEDLKKINKKLWNIEDNIRACERNRDFGDAFIDLARDVYYSNDKRSEIKRMINERLRSVIMEEKSYCFY